MTNKTLTPIFRGNKKKLGEILRLQEFITQTGLQITDISGKTGVSERTIKNTIYENIPIGGKFLRALHLFYGVSIDWLLTGSGNMLIGNQANKAAEPATESSTGQNQRSSRIHAFISDWMSRANEDEQAWLETELKFKIGKYQSQLGKIDNPEQGG